ncbi:hypothetical protein HG531_005573 [Fusarium graminearum]|nr:hypothetical protein HG531_005573 [Fusarium graminearum]
MINAASSSWVVSVESNPFVNLGADSNSFSLGLNTSDSSSQSPILSSAHTIQILDSVGRSSAFAASASCATTTFALTDRIAALASLGTVGSMGTKTIRSLAAAQKNKAHSAQLLSTTASRIPGRQPRLSNVSATRSALSLNSA